jgi:hypothetical protein
MKSFGAFLIILGAGSFVLPRMGMQFWVMEVFGNARPAVAVGAIGVGVALLLVGMIRKPKKPDAA